MARPPRGTRRPARARAAAAAAPGPQHGHHQPLPARAPQPRKHARGHAATTCRCPTDRPPPAAARCGVDGWNAAAPAAARSPPRDRRTRPRRAPQTPPAPETASAADPKRTTAPGRAPPGRSARSNRSNPSLVAPAPRCCTSASSGCAASSATLTGMIGLPSERAIASSAKHHCDSTDAALPTNSTASARRNCEYSSASQRAPAAIPRSAIGVDEQRHVTPLLQPLDQPPHRVPSRLLWLTNSDGTRQRYGTASRRAKSQGVRHHDAAAELLGRWMHDNARAGTPRARRHARTLGLRRPLTVTSIAEFAARIPAESWPRARNGTTVERRAGADRRCAEAHRRCLSRMAVARVGSTSGRPVECHVGWRMLV